MRRRTWRSISVSGRHGTYCPLCLLPKSRSIIVKAMEGEISIQATGTPAPGDGAPGAGESAAPASRQQQHVGSSSEARNSATLRRALMAGRTATDLSRS
jgi:hypothetical protein